MANYSWLQIGVRADTSAMERSIAQASTRAGNSASRALSTTIGSGLSRAAGGIASSFGSTLSRGVSAVTNTLATGMATATGGALAFGGAVATAGVNYNVLQQKSRAAFTTILGSSKAADQMMARIADFAQTSPFPRQAFIEATQTMVSFGVESQKVIPYLGAIQDAVAATGGSAQDITDITYVLSQIQSAGKITATDLMQLGQRGINAAELIGQSMGKTGPQIKDAISAGTLDATDALDALTAGMEKRFGGAAANVKNTWDGATDRIKGAMRDIGSVLVAPFIDPKGGGLALDFANKLADLLRGLEPAIQPFMTAVMRRLRPLLRRGLDLLTGWTDKLQGVDAKRGGKGVLDFITGLADGLGDMAPLLGAAGAGLAAMGGANISQMLGPLGGLVPKLNPLLAAVVALVAASPELRQTFGDMIKQLGPLIGTIAKSFTPVLQAIAPLLTLLGGALGGVLVDLVKAAVPLIKDIAGTITDFAKDLGPVIPQLATFAASIGTLLIDAIRAIMPLIKAGLVTALQLISAALAVINPILEAVVGLLNNPVLKVIATVIAGIAAAWWALNAAAFAFMANPIGAIIGAIALAVLGLIVGIRALIKHWTTIWNGIKKVAQVVWRAIQTAISWAWDKVIKPVWSAMQKAIDALAGVFRWLWHKVIEPVWGGIKKAISLYWNYYIHPIFKAIQAALGVLAAAFRWLWHKVIQPVWNGIKSAISTVWRFIKQRIFAPIQDGVDALGDVFRWLWHKAVQPAWGGIKSAINTAWKFIKNSIFTPIHNAIDSLADAFRWLWHKVIQPVWDGIKSAIRAAWRFGIRPVLDVFRGFADVIKKAWDNFPTAIGKIFDGIKKAIGTPIYWTASKILRPLINGINFLISKIGIPEIPVKWIESIPHFKFHQGGKVPGGYGGGDRVHALLEPGEWVLTKAQSRAIGYATLAGLPRFAEGGMVGGGGAGAPPLGRSWWNPIDVVKSIGGAVRGAWDKVYQLGADIVAEGGKLLRAAAGTAFHALTVPLRKLAEPYAEMKSPPANVMWPVLGKFMLTVLDKAEAFIRGHTEEEIAAIGPGTIAAKAVEVATRQIGKPYVFGAHGPGSFDCSGLVEYSYRMAGYPDGHIPGPPNAIGSYTGNQVTHGWKVGSAIPGDAVFYFRPGANAPHHVAIATSPSSVIHAPDVGMNVMRSALGSAGMSGDNRMIRRFVKEDRTSVGPQALANLGTGAPAVWKALRAYGWNPAQAAGIMGNIQTESGFNPYIIQGGGESQMPSAAGSGGYGLVQWTPGAKLAHILGAKPPTIANQVWALTEQLHGRTPYPEGAAGDALQGVHNPVRAARIFGLKYERYAGGVQDERGAQARVIWERFHKHKYDAGGWLPPGTSLVQNNTRKPEPVLTDDQWRKLTDANAARQRSSTQRVVGGSLDIGADSQGRLRAWVQDLILDEVDYGDSLGRMGGPW